MTRAATIPETVTVRVAFRVIKRGGRKQIVPPPDAPATRPRIDSALIKALARGVRWKRTLDSGEFATISELAEHEKIALSYMTRVLRLTLLAPDIVEAILDGRLAAEVTLAKLLQPLPLEWLFQSTILTGDSADQQSGARQ
jgi:hypothetical protein